MKKKKESVLNWGESLILSLRYFISFSFIFIVFLLSTSAFANELTGTWRGVLTQGSSSFEVEWTFSDAGNLIISYSNNKGNTRYAELAYSGQKIEYVPLGGGVKTHYVESIQKGSRWLTFVLITSFEKASNGYLDQQYDTEQYIIELQSQGLVVQITSQLENYYGDNSGSYGGPSGNVAYGVLRKVNY